MAHVKHGNLAIEADARTGNQRLFVLDAGAINGVPRDKVIATIEDDIGLGDALLQRFARKPLAHRDDFDVGINFQQGAARGNRFCDANGIISMNDLPLQIGEIDDIAIANRELADAAGGKVKRRRRPKAAGTDNQRLGLI